MAGGAGTKRARACASLLSLGLSLLCANHVASVEYRIAVMHPDVFDNGLMARTVQFAEYYINSNLYSDDVYPGSLPSLFANGDSVKFMMLNRDVYGNAPLYYEAARNASLEGCVGNYSACPRALAFVGAAQHLDTVSLQIYASANGILHVHPFSTDARYAFGVPEKSTLKTLYRMRPNSVLEVGAILSYVRLKGWGTVSVISDSAIDDSVVFTSQVQAQAMAAGISVQSATQLLPMDADGTRYDATKVLAAIRDSGYRVIVLNALARATVAVLDQARAMGMVGPEWVWLGTSYTVALETQLRGVSNETMLSMDGMVAVIASQVRRPTPAEPIEPCNTIAAQYTAQADAIEAANPADPRIGQLRAASALYGSAVSTLCLQLLWKAAHEAGNVTAPSTLNSTAYDVLVSGLYFDGLFAAAKAVSDVAGVVRDCAVGGAGAPGAVACARLGHFGGQRREVIERFRSLDYTGITSRIHVNASTREVDRPFVIINLRREYIINPTASPTLGAYSIIGRVSRDGVVSTLESATYYGGSTATPLGRVRSPEENLNQISMGFIRVGLVMGTLALTMCVYCAVWTVRHRSAPIVVAAQGNALLAICAGSALMTTVIFFAGVDDQLGYSHAELGAACNAQLWAYAFGFALSYLALLLKLFKILRVVQSAKQMRVARFNGSTVVWATLAALGFEAAVLGGWSVATGGFSWERVCIDRDVFGVCVESRGVCRASDMAPVAGVILCGHFGVMIYGLLLCYRLRNIPGEFSESGWITAAIVCNFQLTLLAVFLLYNSADDPGLFYVVKVGATFLIVISTQVALFATKMYMVWRPQERSSVPVMDRMAAHVRQKQGEHNQDLKNNSGGPMSTEAKSGASRQQDGDARTILLGSTTTNKHIRRLGRSTLGRSTFSAGMRTIDRISRAGDTRSMRAAVTDVELVPVARDASPSARSPRGHKSANRPNVRDEKNSDAVGEGLAQSERHSRV